jgi:hypothetical protein
MHFDSAHHILPQSFCPKSELAFPDRRIRSRICRMSPGNERAKPWQFTICDLLIAMNLCGIAFAFPGLLAPVATVLIVAVSAAVFVDFLVRQMEATRQLFAAIAILVIGSIVVIVAGMTGLAILLAL